MQAQTESTILVVDDTPRNLLLLTAILERRRYNVVSAENGADALKKFEEHQPDLVLLDIMMPIMNGFDVCKKLKEDPTSAEIPIIFISALDDTQDIVHAFDVGGVDYVTKPFKSKEVLRRVESHLTLLHQRRQLASIREEERTQFARINTMREEFIRAATHDLKNPLSLITGYTSLMEMLPAAKESTEIQEYIQLIRHGSNRMRALVQDMLDLIQIQSSEERFNPQVVPLDEVLRQVLLDFEVIAGDKQLTLEINLPDENVPILIDRHMMRQVFQQLFSNAVKFCEPGDRITVTLQNTHQQVEVIVADTGIGIPEDYHKEIFKPFFRVPDKAHQEREGNGLGLSTALAIMERHGGEILVGGTGEGGSKFTMVLPL